MKCGKSFVIPYIETICSGRCAKLTSKSKFNREESARQSSTWHEVLSGGSSRDGRCITSWFRQTDRVRVLRSILSVEKEAENEGELPRLHFPPQGPFDTRTAYEQDVTAFLPSDCRAEYCMVRMRQQLARQRSSHAQVALLLARFCPDVDRKK